MAELVAGPFISFVVERLGDLLIQEAKFLGGVRGQVEQMQTELNWMQCFLKDADAKREGDKRVHNWVAEIREVAYDAEDVIEMFVIKVAFRRRTGILNVLMRYSCVVKDCITLCKVGLEIQSIRTKISGITSSLQTYGITATRGEESSSSRHERQRQARQTYPHIMEEDIVGLDKDLKTIVEYLVEEERPCRVVCIWGMGGLGKTTLAKMVYNHMEVRRHFDYFAWACISQQCNTREVLEGILIKLTSASQERREIKEMKHDELVEKLHQASQERREIKEMKHDELVEKLHQIQSQKKCLVILDDIWKPEDWDSLSPAFPKKKVGSKILLTTCIGGVASFVDQQCFLHELRTLTEAESWELFEKKASLRRNDTEFRVSREMMELGKKMVKRCGGLPLAIVVLGGLLGTKHTVDDWDTVYRNISYHLSKGKGHERVKDVLALSYQDLPYHLKACSLYLSHLPEDYGIH